MRIAYLILNVIVEILLVLGMMYAPIYVTPGWYFWSGMFGVLFFMNSFALTQRLDKWEKLDLKIKKYKII